MFCHSAEDRSRGCGSGRVGSGWPSTILRGRVCFGVCCAPSPTGEPGTESLTAMLVRLRFNVDFAPFAGFSTDDSGAAGAASSRARALVDRRGSVMVIVVDRFSYRAWFDREIVNDAVASCGTTRHAKSRCIKPSGEITGPTPPSLSNAAASVKPSCFCSHDLTVRKFEKRLHKLGDFMPPAACA
jgi:hypothetical protein